MTDQTPSPGEGSAARWRGVTRLVLPAVVTAIGVAAYLGQAERGDAAASGGTARLAAEQLQVGDCFDDAGSDGATRLVDVTVKPCHEPHDHEVFHSFTLRGVAPPSSELVYELADAECVDAFDLFVGTVYEASELDLFPVWPSDDAWEVGERTATCAVYAVDGSKLEGSARGSRR